MKYIGNGDFIPGIPARDLSDEEVKEYSRKTLLDSGLYEEQKKERNLKHGSDIIDEDTNWS